YSSPPNPGAFPPLGTVLNSVPLTDGPTAVVEFGLALKRDLQTCRVLPDGSERCSPAGVAGLGNDGTGPGENAAGDIWNARFLRVQGTVRYRPGRDPTVKLCRDPTNGGVIGNGAGCAGKATGAPCSVGGISGRCYVVIQG